MSLPKSAAARASKILPLLRKMHPNAHCELNHRNPLELLVATILSAQCTDKRVNLVTGPLFKKFKTAQDYAQAKLPVLEQVIKSTGFYHSKAKSIIGCCQGLVRRFGGKVPQRLEDLITLPGVGRKTANVVLGNAFGIPGITVDTHVRRLSQRMGLSNQEDPDKIEQDLMKLLPPKEWTQISHELIFHGRYVCKAIKPQCDQCLLPRHCPYYQTVVSGQKKS